VPDVMLSQIKRTFYKMQIYCIQPLNSMPLLIRLCIENLYDLKLCKSLSHHLILMNNMIFKNMSIFIIRPYL